MPEQASTPGPRLAELTTLRLGGPARSYVAASTPEELAAAVDAADATGEPVLVLGGGSNLVVADEGFDGTVVHATGGGIRTVPAQTPEGAPAVEVTVAAGEDWDALVARAVAEGWAGVEALSGIPGTVGATPVQNVGAYGQEVAQTITRVRVWDRTLRGERVFTGPECRFGYRHSRFKADRYDAWGSRHVVLEVTFRFPLPQPGTTGATGPQAPSMPVAYAELARTLGVEVGRSAPLGEVRDAVLGLRRGKGMVLDADDHDTWSAGSFFTNPFTEPDRVPAGAPSYPQPDGRVKTSAAWLIEHAGFAKGHGLDRPGAHVALSTKHTLALTNRGGASTAELLAFAREVRDGVRTAFGIELVNEPVTVGCSL